MADLKTLTDKTFAADIATGSIVVDFWAPWCGPCRMVGPVLEELNATHGDKVAFGKLNVDENPETAGKYGVRSIPTIILFRDGEPAKTVVGARGKGDFEKEFELV